MRQHLLSIPAPFHRRTGVGGRVVPSAKGKRTMANTEKPKGPTSYFPSIEKRYGQPIDHWMNVLKNAGPLKHMELVNLLKADHGMGHGHANALVAAFVARGSKA
jgi:hypothetical protein